MKAVYMDFQKISLKLAEIFEDLKTPIQTTLLYNGRTTPHPILRDREKIIKGINITGLNFRRLNKIKHEKRVLAVDASLKTLFDCGSFKIIIGKVAGIIWKGRRRYFEKEHEIRAKLVRTKLEALEFLFEIELSTAYKMSKRIGEEDYCILDRPLIAVPAYRERTIRVMKNFCRAMAEKKIRVVGISKTSKLEINTGESLLGYLYSKGEKLMKNKSWYYHPLFKLSQYPKWYLGDVTIVKFSSDSKHVFRVDVNRRDPEIINNLKEVLGEIAYLDDPSIPGYPYPPRCCHEEAKISKQELETLRLTFLEEMKKFKLKERLILNTKSSNFREEELWR